jgi:hypothetical protein
VDIESMKRMIIENGGRLVECGSSNYLIKEDGNQQNIWQSAQDGQIVDG